MHPELITDADPTFPPLLNGRGVVGVENVFDEVCRLASEGKIGAGDVLWGRDTGLVEIAIVLEPEVGMDTAVQMLPLAMVAIGDCLGVLTPPQVGVTFVWPNVLCINGAPAGEFRSAVSAKKDEDGIPDWMAIGLELRHLRGPEDPEPGETPDMTWLAEEGGGELTRTDIIESFSRHFLTWLHNWNDEGFKAVHGSWMFRAQHRDQDVTLTHGGEEISGAFLGLDENGNMLVKTTAGDSRVLNLSDYFSQYPGGTAGR